jgi:hypothetical protein
MEKYPSELRMKKVIVPSAVGHFPHNKSPRRKIVFKKHDFDNV